MTDFLLPPDLGIAAATPNLDANTASFKSPTVGSTRSVERLGDALRFQFNFTTVNDDPAMKRQRGRLQAFLSSLRGQSGRVWMTPPGALLRGSFPAPELFSNNDFASGVTGWSADGTQYFISAIDRGVRANRIAGSGAGSVFQAVSRSAATPYCLRGFVSAARGSALVGLSDFGDGAVFAPTVSQGFLENAYTIVSSGSSNIGFRESGSSGAFAGNCFDIKWASFSRCALVDNGVNLLTFSDDLTNGAWTTGNFTPAAGTFAGPDGIVEGTKLTENTASSVQHFVDRTANITVPSAAGDYTIGCFIFALNRIWAALQIQENTGPSAATQWFNLATGVKGTGSSGSNMAFKDATITNYGNGWFYCTLTARKTNAATAMQPVIYSAIADASTTYAGTNGLAALQVLRETMAPSSVAIQPISTAASAIAAGTLQTGLPLNLKGLPLSTAGLLLPGDWIECGGQLNQLAANLDSDAAGLGTAILTRPPRNSPADSTGFVVNNPMGRFLVTSNSTGWNEMPGRMSDASLELVEDISF